MADRKKLGETAEFRIKRKKKKGMARWQKVLMGMAVLFCAIVLLASSMYAYYKHIYKPAHSVDTNTHKEYIESLLEKNEGDNPGAENTLASLSVDKSKYTFLVIGTDRRAWLTDVMMVATYDIKKKSLSIMQIPRDTYVALSEKLNLDENGIILPENFAEGSGSTGHKMNEVMWFGASFAEAEMKRLAELAKGADDAEITRLLNDTFIDIDKTLFVNYLNSKSSSVKAQILYNVKLDFGIKYVASLLTWSFCTPIDYYVQMNLDGFVNIVDAIGGVDVYVQEDMDYDDPTQNLHIHIKKGQQHLDGKDAEGFVRFRQGYAAADIARTNAQKIFMTAFIKKVVSLDGLMNIDDLVEEVLSNLKTNITFNTAASFAVNAIDIDFSKINMFTMPGSSLYKNGVSYYSVDKTTLVDYVNKYLSKYTDEIDEKYFYAIEIAAGNESTPPMTAEDIKDNQPDLGFITYVPSTPDDSEPSEDSDTGENPDDSADNKDASGKETENKDDADNADNNEISDNTNVDGADKEDKADENEDGAADIKDADLGAQDSSEESKEDNENTDENTADNLDEAA